MIWRAGQHRFRFPRPAILMGIVNVTPDSFSDGGRYLESAAAVDHAHRLVEEGAEIIDIGGESTRPRALPVSEAEELRRVMPVIEGLAGRTQAILSIDTYKPGVARHALAAGATLVNDVGANRCDPVMAELLASSGAGYVLMHMQGTPQTMQVQPQYADVVSEVGTFFEDQLKRLTQLGVSSEQVALDVGLGFGKTRAHNLELVARLQTFERLGRPCVLGASRKSFLSNGAVLPPAERLPAALAVACWAVGAGAQILRTHDVGQTRQAVRLMEELLGKSREISG
jgi:dihydropteroate synthase